MSQCENEEASFVSVRPHTDHASFWHSAGYGQVPPTPSHVLIGGMHVKHGSFVTERSGQVIQFSRVQAEPSQSIDNDKKTPHIEIDDHLGMESVF